VNLILAIPFELRLALLALLGAWLGGALNLGVYRLAYSPRTLSPWCSPPAPGALPRRWSDRLPIVGWLGLRRETSLHGAGFWIRPLLLEIFCAVGLPALYWWEVGVAGATDWHSQLLPAALQFALNLPTRADDRANVIAVLHLVFLAHALLSGLMIVAALIDADEGVIPDEITVPGAMLGVSLAALVPAILLPVMRTVLPVGGLGLPDHRLDFLRFCSPRDWPWPGEALGKRDIQSLAVGLGCLWLWCIGLMPRTWRTRHGLRRAVEIFWARLVRESLTYWALGIGLVSTIATVAVWRWSGVHWQGMLTAWVGVAAGGGLVWAVRIVGSRLLGREAMGFGDVTLLAMIGTFLGWQACLVIFLLAPLAGAVIGVAQWLLKRGNEIRYGPFLCLAAWVTIVRWAAIWGDPQRGEGISNLFEVGWLIPAALAVCLIVMVPLLWIVRRVGDWLRGQ